MRILVFAFAIGCGPGAFAQSILFRAADAPESEYRARLRAEEPWRTPTQAYLAQHPSARSREQLTTRFTRAQRAFLDDSPGAAGQHFREVVALLPADDWSRAQREAFLHAYLRLAQLEGEGATRDRWLIEAQYLGEDLTIESDLFPPPVVARYRALARQLPRFTPAIEGAEWPLILINGIACRPGRCPSVPAPSQNVRVTFVSDQWIAQTMNVDVAKLSRLKPGRFSWVRGNCAQSELATAARELGEGRAFFGLACELPTFLPRVPLVTAEAESRSFAPPVPAAPRTRLAMRSRWIWVGVGAAVLAGVALALRPPARDAHSPARDAHSPAPTAAAPSEVYGY